MTKITRNDEDSPLVHEEGQENGCVLVVLILMNITNVEGQNLQVIRSARLLEQLIKKRQLHFEAVLVLLDLFEHEFDIYDTFRFSCYLNERSQCDPVDLEIAERRLPRAKIRSQETVLFRDFVEGSKQNNAIEVFNVLLQVLVGVTLCGPTL